MSETLQIRTFAKEDETDVVALWNDALPSLQPWNEPQAIIRRKLRAADGLFFVGECDGRIVATVIAGYDGIRGWIYAVAVSSECRRRGFGRRMIEHAEQALRSRGCPKINLQVRGSNTDVVTFYEGLQYESEDRVSMGKPLSASTSENIAELVPTIDVGDGFTLSQIRRADKPSYLEHLNETDQFNRFMWLIPFPYTERDADEWLDRSMSSTLETDGVRNWAIRGSSGELIGGIGLLGLKIGERAEVGYWLAKSHWGRGVMPRVLRGLVEHAFDEYRLLKLFARVIGGNDQSQSVLQKVGFQKEGTFRDHEFRDGESFDLHFYGLTKAPYARAD